MSNFIDDVDIELHPLADEWTLWHHTPQDNNWKIDSYHVIMEIDTVEQTLALTSELKDFFIKNSMLFLMKKGVKPMWEDPRNCRGGSFSFKVKNENAHHVWCQLTYAVTGGFISQNEDFLKKITGITLSPKRGTCIVKIWMEDPTFQNASLIEHNIDGLEKHGCLFVEHVTKTDFKK